MQARYHLQNNTDMIEFDRTEEGIKKAKQYRRDHLEFKYRPIKVVLQAFPGRINTGQTYSLTFSNKQFNL